MFARGAPFAPINNAAINEYVLSIDDATNNNRASMYRDGTTAGPGFIVTSGGVSATQPAPTGTWAQNASGKVAFAVAANDLAATFNASAISAVGTATMPVTPTTVRLGQQPNGIRWWGGYIERIALWPTTRVPNGDLQRIAAP
jgi:hypothetical protein